MLTKKVPALLLRDSGIPKVLVASTRSYRGYALSLHAYYKVGCNWTYTYTDAFHGNTRSPAVVATGAPNVSEGHRYLLHQATN